MTHIIRTARIGEEVRRWAIVVLIVLLIVVGYQVNRINRSVDKIKDSSARTETSADELVKFVHEIQTTQPSSQTQQAVRTVIDVLCASSDPVRIQACTSLTKPGG